MSILTCLFLHVFLNRIWYTKRIKVALEGFKLNTLSYVLLCMLARKSCTGYELKQYMELFWQAHHSQIYTVLGKMEAEGYVQFEADPDTTKKNLFAYR